MRRALLAVTLVALAAGAAPRWFSRDCWRDNGGLRSTRGFCGGYSWAYFEFARDAGAGAPVLGLDYAVPLCSTLAENEKVGAWSCVDGSSAIGTNTGASTTYAAYGSGQSDATLLVCPNGSACGSENGRRWTNAGAITESAATTNGTTGVTFCSVFQADLLAANPDILTHGTAIAPASVAWAMLRASGTLNVYASDGVTRDVASISGVTGGAVHVACGAWSPATGLRACLDGACSSATAHATMQALSAKTTFGGYNAVLAAEQTGVNFGGFVTYTDLGDTRIKAIQHAVLADQPKGVVQGVASAALTFTRATVKSCPADTTGAALSILPSGRPCVTMGGLHVEGAATNQYPRSEEINNAAWSDSTAGAAAAPTLNGTDTAVSPWGTLTAEDYTFPATAATQASGRITASAAACVGVACTYSVYVKGQSGSGTMDLCVYGGAVGQCGACAFNSTTWTRCTTTQTSVGVASLWVGNNTLWNGGTSRSSNRVFITGAMGETGTVATSYIPTTSASAARNADSATSSVDVSALAAAGSVAATITVPYTGNASYGILQLNSGAGSRELQHVINVMRIFDSTNTVDTATFSPPANTPTRCYSTWSGSTMGSACTGVAQSSGTFDGSMVVTGGVLIGSGFSGALGGVISNVIISPDPARAR